MSILAPEGAAAPAPGRPEPLTFAVALGEGRRTAVLTVTGGGGAPGPEALRGAYDALRVEGVVHGIDREAVAAAVRAADGVPRPVARATEAVAPVDGVLDLLFAQAAGRDPFHTVEPGALIARYTPPSEGDDGVTVTGDPIPAGQPRDPAPTAGAGAAAEAGEEGVVVIRAAAEGRPGVKGSSIVVDDVVSVPAVGSGAGSVVVHGSLHVAGGVVEGSRITVTGSLTVGGTVDRAHLDAAGDITLGGTCAGSTIVAGARAGVYRRLLEMLDGVDAGLETACAMARQLVASGAEAGRAVVAEEALAAVVASRFPELGPALRRAEEMSAGADGVGSRIVDAVGRAGAVLACLARGDPMGLDRVDEAAQVLGDAMDEMRAGAAGRADIRAPYMQACHVSVEGDLLLTGAGTYNTHVVAGGDVRAEGSTATVRGGSLTAAGRVAAHELGAPGGAPVRVTLEGTAPGERLHTGVAHPGLDVLCAGSRIAVDATTLNFVVRIDEENRVVTSGQPPG
jgi:uncharacterized protein (DUF342 family)